MLTAKYRDKPIDRATLVLAMIAISLPMFWLGRLLQFQFAYRDDLFPVAGLTSWWSLILPSITLGVAGAGFYARLVHANMIEVLNQDYIRSARARGLSEPAVLFKHALAQCVDSGADRVGHGHRRAVGRRRFHREHLRAAGPWRRWLCKRSLTWTCR